MSNPTDEAEQGEIHDAITTALFADNDQDSDRAGEFLAGPACESAVALMLNALEAALPLSGVTIRCRAARTLAKFGPRAKNCIPELLPLLNTDEPAVAAMAAYAVWRIGSTTEPALSTFIRVLDTADTLGRHTACWALGQMGVAAAPALPILAAALQEADSEARLYVVPTHGRIALAAFRAELPTLGKTAIQPLLSDDDPELRFSAYHALHEIQPCAAGVELLQAGLRDPDSRVRRQCAMLLGAWGGCVTTAGQALFDALHDSNLEVRGMAAVALCLLNLQTNAVLPILAEASEQGSQELAALAGQTLRNLVQSSIAESAERAEHIAEVGQSIRQASDDDAIFHLIATLQDETSDDRAQAAAAELLAQIGPRAAAAIPALVKLFRSHPREFVRARALDALGAAGQNDRQVLAIVVEALRDPGELVRLRAAWVLRGLGREALAALPALRAANGDTSRLVAEAVAETIRQLADVGESARTNDP